MAIQSVSVRRAIVRSCEKIVPHVMTGMVPSRVPVIRTPHACFTCQSAAKLFIFVFVVVPDNRDAFTFGPRRGG